MYLQLKWGIMIHSGLLNFFFFFSSRRRHTRLTCHWSSDVCSSDLTIFISARVEELERRLRERATESAGEIGERIDLARKQLEQAGEFDYVIENDDLELAVAKLRSEERRVGKECRSRRGRHHEKKRN